jgi:hypothetical protein
MRQSGLPLRLKLLQIYIDCAEIVLAGDRSPKRELKRFYFFLDGFHCRGPQLGFQF